MEYELVTKGRSRFKSIIHQPLFWTKIIRLTSGFVSSCQLTTGLDAQLFWESFHKAPPLPSCSAPRVLTGWYQTSLNICASTGRHFHLIPCRKMEKTLICRWSNPLALCATACCSTQRSRHCASGSARAKLPICKMGCDLSNSTNFPSEFSIVDIKYKSIQKKGNRKKKTSLHSHLEKQMEALEAACGS